MEGTATINIDDLDNYRKFEEAVLKRKVFIINTPYNCFGGEGRKEFLLIDENEVFTEAEREIDERNRRIYELERELRGLKDKIRSISHIDSKTNKSKKWWRI
jgi:hypothetical protein